MNHKKSDLFNQIRKIKKNTDKNLKENLISSKDTLHEPFPLTDMQQAYWLGAKDEISASSMRFYVEYDIEDFRIHDFHSAWNQIIKTHDMLRVVLLPKEGLQKILKWEDLEDYSITLVDLSKWDNNKKLDYLLSIRNELKQKKFNLESWPPFEIQAYRIDEKNTRLFISLNVWSIDGHSLNRILTDLNDLYHHPTKRLDQFEISFRDYVFWKMNQEKTDNYKIALAYWKKQLQDLSPPPQLPYQKQSNGENVFQRLEHQFNLQEKTFLIQRAADLGISINGLLLGVFSEVLALWSETTNFTINIPQFNRPTIHQDFNQLVGEFATFMLLDIHHSFDLSFKERIIKVQQILWKNLEYRQVSGIKLLRERTKLTGSIDLDAMPIVFTTSPDGIFNIEILGKVVFNISETPQVWLDAQYHFSKDHLLVNWDYIPGKFHSGVVESMFKAYVELIEHLATDQGDTLLSSQYPIKIPQAQIALRNSYNTIQLTYDKRSVFQQFASIALDEEQKNKVAVLAHDGQYTYQALCYRSMMIGQYLAERKLNSHSKDIPFIVAILLFHGKDQSVSIMSALAAGAAYLPLNVEYTSEMLLGVLEDAQPDFILVNSLTEEMIPKKFKAHVLNLDKEFLLEEQAKIELDENICKKMPGWDLQENDLLCLIYTSGSTGKPKGVLLEQKGILNVLEHGRRDLHFNSNSIVLGMNVVHHDVSIFDFLGTFATGGRLIMVNPEARKDPKHWGELIKKHEINFWVTIPTALEMFLSWNKNLAEQFSSLKIVATGGEKISLTLYERFKQKAPNISFYSLGGPTETTMWNSYEPINQIEDGWTSVPYGVPIPNCQYFVLNAALQDCPDWVVGEMYCGGISLARGYLNDQEKTNQSFIIHPQTKERLYKTGDIGRYHPDGRLEFLGRNDGQLKIRGNRIEKEGVRLSIQQWEEIETVVPYLFADQLAVAVVLKDEYKELDHQYLRKKAEKLLLPAMNPDIWLLLDQIPLTHNFKLDMNELYTMTRFIQEGNIHNKNRVLTKQEEQLADIWEKLLGRRPHRPLDNFFAFGGDSLTAVKLISMIYDELDHHLSLTEIFENPSLEQQAALLKSEIISDKNAQTHHISDYSDLKYVHPLSWSQEGIWFIENLSGGIFKFNVLFCFEIREKLNVIQLKWALNQIKSRHIPLNSFYKIEKDHLVQYPAKDSVLPFSFHFIHSKKELKYKIDYYANKKFNLEKELPWEIGLFQTEDSNELFLLFNFHHIAFDGNSLNIFLNELKIYYESNDLEKNILPPVNPSYIDYVYDNRKDIENHFAEYTQFWLNLLKDSNDLLIQADYERTPRLVLCGGCKRRYLSKEIKEQLDLFTREQEITPYLIFLATYEILLGYYADQDDFLLGSYDSGRNHAQTQGIIGCFVNNVVHRVVLDPDETFLGYLKQLKKIRKESIRFQQLPFAKLVQAMKIDIDVSRYPLYQNSINFQGGEIGEFKLGEACLNPIEIQKSIVRMDFELFIWYSQNDVILDLNYNANVFSEQKVEGFLKDYEILLKHAILTPKLKLSELVDLHPKLIPDFYKEIDYDQQNTALIEQLFIQLNNRKGTVITHRDEKIDYQELLFFVGGIAYQLKELNLIPEQILFIRMERSLKQIATILACIYLGVPYCPVVDKMMQDINDISILSNKDKGLTTYCLQDKQYEDDIIGVESLIVTDERRKILPKPYQFQENDTIAYRLNYQPENNVYYLTAIQYFQLLDLSHSLLKYYSNDEQKTTLYHSSLDFFSDLTEILLPLFFNSSIVIYPEFPKNSEHYSLMENFIEKNQVSHLWLNKAEFKYLTRFFHQDAFHKNIHYLFNYENCLNSKYIKDLFSYSKQLTIINYYVVKGVGLIAKYEVPREIPAEIPLGKMIQRGACYLLDRWGNGRPCQISGVLKLKQEDGWLVSTEDYISLGQDGLIYFHGKPSDQICIRNVCFNKLRLFNLLDQFIFIQDYCVDVLERNQNQRELILFLKLEQSDKYDVNKVKRIISERLPSYMVPHQIIIVDEIPDTLIKKIDSINSYCQSKKNIDIHSTENKLIQIWRKFFPNIQISVTDNFFHCGGNSLLAVELLVKIKEEFKVEIGLAEILKHPVLSDMAQWIDKGEPLSVPVFIEQPRTQRAYLTFAQRRIWLATEFDPTTRAYILPFTYCITGDLDIARFREKLYETIARHSILSSVIRLDETGEPYLEQRPASEVAFRFDDLSQDISQLASVEQEELRTVFNLSQDILLKIRLVKVKHNHYRFYFISHHIIFDGVSIEVFFNDLMAHYQGEALEALVVDFYDYARWERSEDYLKSLSMGLEYWRQRLAGMEPLQLPHLEEDKCSETELDYQILSRKIATDTVSGLQELAKEYQLTPFSLYSIALQIALARIRIGGDVIFGTYVSGRIYPEFTQTIGTFVNPLALRFEYDEEQTLRSIFESSRHQISEDFSWQHIPFEKIVEIHNPTREVGKHPLFGISLIYNEGIYSEHYTGSGITIIANNEETSIQASRTDIEFWITPIGGENQITVVYLSEVGSKLVTRLVDLLLEIINMLPCIDLGKKLKELPVSGQSKWSGEEKSCWFRGIVSGFRNQVFASFDSICVVESARRMTRLELERCSNKVATLLVSSGVQQNEVVAVLSEHSIELVVSALSVLKAGGILLFLEPIESEERLEYIIRDAGVKNVLLSPRVRVNLPSGIKIIQYPSHLKELPEQAYDLEGEISYLIYTSGSTGKPKGVLGTRSSLLNRIHWMKDCYPVQIGEKQLLKTSVSFIDIMSELFGSLLLGIPLVIASDEIRKEPSRLMVFMEEQEISRLTLTPSLLAALCEELERSSKQLRTLKVMISSGEKLSIALSNKVLKLFPGVKLLNLYGSSEIGADVTYYEVSGTEQSDVPVGRLLDNCHAKLVGQESVAVPVGFLGELWISGECLSGGYWNDDELNRKYFVEEERRWFKTGDIGYVDEGGELHLLGRKDSQVKIRGVRINLQGIDEITSACPGVILTCACVVKTKTGEEVLGLGLVAQEDLSEAQLRDYLAERLATTSQPSMIVKMEKLPLLPGGKIDRRAVACILEKQYIDNISSGDISREKTKTEIQIEEIWRELLQIEHPIGLEQNFFQIGGHSLFAARLSARLRTIFSANVSMTDIFKHPTILQQAILVSTRKIDIDLIRIPMINKDELLEVSVNQERLWFLQQINLKSVSYNMTFGFKLIGKLDLSKFTLSLNQLVERHESFRTRFIEVVDENGFAKLKVQIVSNVGIMPFYQRVVDNFEEEAQKSIYFHQNQPFNMENPPLIRVSIIEGNEHNYVLIICMHHIIADGWSVGVLMKDLCDLYNDRTLEKLSIQYSDFAQWQRNLLDNETFKKEQYAFWKAYIKNIPECIHLPIDFPRKYYQFNPAGIKYEKLTGFFIKQLIHDQKKEVYDYLLGAFFCTLYQWGCGEDLVIGTALLGRHYHPELEKIVGFFANTIPVRLTLNGELMLNECMNQLIDSRKKTIAHQDISFDQIVEISQHVKSTKYPPLVQVMFTYQNAPFEKFILNGVDISTISLDSSEAKFDLMIQVLKLADGLLIQVEYNKNLFRERTIERFIEGYQRVLELILTKGEVKLSELEVLTTKMSYQHGGVIETLPAGTPKNLLGVLRRTAKNYPEHGIHFIDGAHLSRITYQELLEISEDYAARIRKSGFKSGLAAILIVGDLEAYIKTLWSALFAGLKPVTVLEVKDYSEDALVLKLLQTWEFLDKPVILSDEKVVAKMQGLKERYADLRVIDIFTLPKSEVLLNDEPDSEDTAFYQLSSGSTGRSKCIEERHSSVIWHMELTTLKRGYSSEDRVMNWLPYDHVGSLLMTHLKDVYFGCEEYNIKTEVIVGEPILWMKLMSQYQLGYCLSPNFGYKLAAEALESYQGDDIDLSHVKELLNAGEMVLKQTMDRFRQAGRRFGLNPEVLVAAYGMAETSTAITYGELGDEQLPSSQLHFKSGEVQMGVTEFVSVGKVIPGVEIRIVNTVNEVVQEYEVGDLHIRGPVISRGYYNLPEENQAVMLDGGWFNSGDRGVIVDGNLYITGRTKEILIVNGVNYFCHDLEERIGQISGVTKTAVAAISCIEEGQEGVMICYVPQAGVADIAKLNQEIYKKLIKEVGLYPRKVLAISQEQFSKTSSGKIQRNLLSKHYQEGKLKEIKESRVSLGVGMLEWSEEEADSELSGEWLGIGWLNQDIRGHIKRTTVLELSNYVPTSELTGFLFSQEIYHDWDKLLVVLKRFIEISRENHYQGTIGVVLCSSDKVDGGRLYGLLNTFLQEQAGWKYWILEVSEKETELKYPQLKGSSGYYRYRAGILQRLNASRAVVAATEGVVQPVSDILLTGGGGGIARVLLADWITRGVSVTLLGRGDCPDWVVSYQEQGIQVNWLQDDLQDREVCIQALKRLSKMPKKIYHLAGIFETQILSSLSSEDLLRSDTAKVKSLETLLSAVKEVWHESYREIKWILFGSMTSVMGASYTGAYSFANGGLLGLAEEMRADGLWVSWLGWSVWQNYGMGRRIDIDAVKNSGLQVITPELGIEVLDKISNRDYLIGLNIEKLPNRSSIGVNSEILLNRFSEEDSLKILLDILKNILNKDQINAHDNFFDLGCTSIQIIQFQRAILQRLGINLDVMTLFEYTNVNSLNKYFFQYFHKDKENTNIRIENRLKRRQNYIRKR